MTIEGVIGRIGLLETPQHQAIVLQESLCGTDFGKLCKGMPIDYCLQENEIEITNEYLFALTAHVIYWSNRDASLFIVKQLYIDEDLNHRLNVLEDKIQKYHQRVDNLCDLVDF